jgi:hypothetical protein
MYRRGMTTYIGAAWRPKHAPMSIATMGAIAAAGGRKFIADPFGSRSNCLHERFWYLDTCCLTH